MALIRIEDTPGEYGASVRPPRIHILLRQARAIIDSTPAILYPAFRNKEVTRVEAYCVKCRAKREVKDAKGITMKNGRPATQGVCPVCGTKMFRIGKS